MLDWARDRSAIIVRVCLLLIAIAAWGYYVYPRNSSFSVSAETEFLSVRVSDSNQPDWFLPNVAACIREEGGSEDATCGRGFRAVTLEDVELKFYQGYFLAFRGYRSEAIEIAVTMAPSAAEVRLDGFDPETGESISEVLTNGSNLVVSLRSGERPYMASRGFAVLGERPGGSGGLVLRRANYEVRQTLGKRNPIVVASGQFLPGDQVNFLRDQCPFWLCFGDVPNAREIPATLVVTDISSSPAFDVILTTPSEPSVIGIARVGSVTSTIPVHWTARLSSDPIPASLATLIGLLGTALALSNVYLTPPGKPASDQTKRRARSRVRPKERAHRPNRRNL